MSDNGALECLAVYNGHVLVGEEVQTVNVGRIVLEEELLLGLCELHDSLEHNSGAVLNELTQGVQIGGEYGGGRVDTLVVLALALAEELLVPLVHHCEAGLVGNEHLNALSLAIQYIAERCVLIAVVLPEVAVGISGACVSGALHQRVDIAACACDGEKSHSGEDGVTAAYIVRNYECFIALLVGELLEGTLCLVGGGVNPALCAVFTVLLYQHVAEYAESQSRLGGCTGLGDDVYGKVLAVNEGNHLAEICRADGVADEVDLGGVLFQTVVQRGPDSLDNCSCAEVGTADADNDEHLAVSLYLCGSLLDACEFFLVIVNGQIQPAEEVVSGAVSVYQLLMSCPDCRSDSVQLVLSNEAAEIFVYKFKCHFRFSPFTDGFICIFSGIFFLLCAAPFIPASIIAYIYIFCNKFSSKLLNLDKQNEFSPLIM